MRLPHRIIPAHAGLTSGAAIWWRRPWDHPRACGAHSGFALGLACPRGSSPRMRGSRKFLHAYLPTGGIIPAHAGLTSFLHLQPRWRRDHPRACGAHIFFAFAAEVAAGSSPRMRGSLHTVGVLVELLRIIPAHAGLTVGRQIADRDIMDHPRACGAH